MEVADEIVVIDDSVVEQAAARQALRPPANDFVMGLLGPVTRLNGRLERPHDLEILAKPCRVTILARVVRSASRSGSTPRSTASPCGPG